MLNISDPYKSDGFDQAASIWLKVDELDFNLEPNIDNPFFVSVLASLPEELQCDALGLSMDSFTEIDYPEEKDVVKQFEPIISNSKYSCLFDSDEDGEREISQGWPSRFKVFQYMPEYGIVIRDLRGEADVEILGFVDTDHMLMEIIEIIKLGTYLPDYFGDDRWDGNKNNIFMGKKELFESLPEPDFLRWLDVCGLFGSIPSDPHHFIEAMEDVGELGNEVPIPQHAFRSMLDLYDSYFQFEYSDYSFQGDSLANGFQYRGQEMLERLDLFESWLEERREDLLPLVCRKQEGIFLDPTNITSRTNGSLLNFEIAEIFNWLKRKNRQIEMSLIYEDSGYFQSFQRIVKVEVGDEEDPFGGVIDSGINLCLDNNAIVSEFFTDFLKKIKSCG